MNIPDYTKTQAFLLDVDKTMTDMAAVIRPETIQAVAAVRAAGYRVGVCTGRGYAELVQLVMPLFSPGDLHVVSGGAQVVQSDGTVFWERIVDDRTVRAIYEAVRPHGDEIGFCQNEVYAGTDEILNYKRNQKWGAKLKHVEELENWSTPLLTVSATHTAVREYVESLTNVQWKFMTNQNGVPYYDVTPKGVTKREGAQVYCQKTNTDPTDLVAVGDSANDREVLEFAGRGVAMGNAAPDIQALADEVIGHTDENGLAEYLLSFLSSD